MLHTRPWTRAAASGVGFVVAVTFIAAGLMALGGDPRVHSLFSQAGDPDWARQLAGACALAGGVVLLWPGLTHLGLGVLAGSLAGGAAAYLASGEPARGLVPFALLIPIGIVALGVGQHVVGRWQWRAAGGHRLSAAERNR